MNNILVTGGAGFIGSHFILQFHDRYKNYRIINLDKLTYAADLTNLDKITKSKRYCFLKGDITDYDYVAKIYEEFKPKGTINFAAESHVDNSIINPRSFVETNVLGTQVLLECAKKIGDDKHRFVQVSTDEVYGSLPLTGKFTEQSQLAPNSPYSASKAAADLLVNSYNRTFGLETLITRCTNNFGPHQHFEKLIPKIIKNFLTGQPVPIYGNGTHIRDWIYVAEHCDAIEKVYLKGTSGEVYNIGANSEMSNIEVAHYICELLNTSSSLIHYVKDRAGHDFRYALDASKIRKELGWKPKNNFKKYLEKTINWYKSKINTTLCLNFPESV